MSEKFKAEDLHLISRLAVVQIVDHRVARAKPDKIDIKFVTDGANKTDQILLFLFGAVLVTLNSKPSQTRMRQRS